MIDLKPKGRRAIPDELINFGRHIIYSEGTKTEPYYVDSIKESIADKYNCEVNDIEIVNGNSDASYSTIGLIDFGENDIKKRLKNGEKINHVWFFFDKDDFEESDFLNACNYENKINNSSKENFEGLKYNVNNDITYHCCWSNEAFELWLYLYFEYNDSALKRDDYIEKLQKLQALKNIGYYYHKNDKGLHSTFIKAGGSIDKAMKSAKKLCAENKYASPSTGVWKFAEYFRRYLK